MAYVKLKRTENSDPEIPAPKYQTRGAAGADIRANLPEELRKTGLIIPAGQQRTVPTGFLVEIEDGYEVQVRMRSGLAHKHGLTLTNGVGTIDCDYRGEIGLIVLNTSDEDFLVEHGMRMSQLVIAPVYQAEFEIVEELTVNNDRAGGYGSTGLKDDYGRTEP